MFKIGEFAALTQIAVSQLRYYDEIDLFTPARVDSDTGYRYYSAEQIPKLDQIIVLRELGFSLDQIRDLQRQHITQAQIWQMLADRREAIIQNVRDEIARLRQLETRLEHFEQQGDLFAHRVMVKAVPPQAYLFTAGRTPEDHQAQVQALYNARYKVKTRQHMLAVVHDTRADFPYEVGYVVDKPLPEAQPLGGAQVMTNRTLPAVEQMACLVYAGRWDDSHAAMSALGFWLEEHAYRIAGPFRKVFLQMSDPASDALAVIELQIPVAKAP